jgi:flavin-dependent dehydrogenase
LKVAVVGAGVSGAIVAQLLSKAGFAVEVYDLAKQYSKPCGEVTPISTLKVLRTHRIEEPQILNKISSFVLYDMNGATIARAAFSDPIWVSIDKSEWVNGLREGLELRVHGVHPKKLASSYDLIIDARGPYAMPGTPVVVWRAYSRTRGDIDPDTAVMFINGGRSIGLVWAFPHGDEINVGGGFVGVSNPKDIATKVLRKHLNVHGGFRDSRFSIVNIAPRIRPRKGNILSVGEAGGYVLSLGGEGIRPAVLTAIAASHLLGGADKSVDWAMQVLEDVRREVVAHNTLIRVSRSMPQPMLARAMSSLSTHMLKKWLGGNVRGYVDVARFIYSGLRGVVARRLSFG